MNDSSHGIKQRNSLRTLVMVSTVKLALQKL